MNDDIRILVVVAGLLRLWTGDEWWHELSKLYHDSPTVCRFYRGRALVASEVVKRGTR